MPDEHPPGTALDRLLSDPGRLLAAAAIFLLGVVVGFVLDGGDPPPRVVVNNPPQPAPAPAPAPPPQATTPSTTANTAPRFRQPRTAEGVFTVTGTVTDIALPAPGTAGRGQVFTTFVIRAESGPPLRAGAGGDLRQDPNVPQALFDPACEGKVRARLTVAPARFQGGFDYGLLRVAVLRDRCGS